MIRMFCVFLVISMGSYSQSQEYLVFFANKQVESNSIDLTQDYYDLPVNSIYVSSLSTKGKVLNSSKWLNAVHYRTGLSQVELEKVFPFISRIIPLNPMDNKPDFLLSSHENQLLGDSTHYGNSFEQLELTETISCLHDNGFDGTGVTIAVLDAGFPHMDTMLAYRKMRQEGRIVDTWDFEDNSANVYHKSTHGTYVTSTIGAELDSSFIGAAPKANFAFYITEIARFERNIEEFNLVMGLERADSIGADICSISLGYRNFDTLQASYGYTDMDGRTTIVAQGVRIARDKGMIISVAAGNSGPGSGTISSPCDVDSILCVGAVGLDTINPSFSSEGPTFDGRIKPDVISVGFATAFVRRDDSVRFGNGTSFAAPLVSGLVACIKQAHPTRTNFEIIEAIKNTSHQAYSPDNRQGYGLPNGCRIDSALNAMGTANLPENNKELQVTVFPNPTTDFIYLQTSEILNSISLVSLDEKVVLSQSLDYAALNYSISLNGLPSGIYVLRLVAKDGRSLSRKVVKK